MKRNMWRVRFAFDKSFRVVVISLVETESEFNVFGGSAVSPVSIREIASGDKHVLVFFQARARIGVSGYIKGQEVHVSAQGILSVG